jgi:hypothetical protein
LAFPGCASVCAVDIRFPFENSHSKQEGSDP